MPFALCGKVDDKKMAAPREAKSDVNKADASELANELHRHTSDLPS